MTAWFRRRHLIWIILPVWLLACAAYLLYSYRLAGLGFPLDDAWIHQTYARSFGLNGMWTFTSGQPSAGSTSPLWTALISIGYALRIKPLVWTYVLGLGIQAGLMAAGAVWFRNRNPGLKSSWIWAAALLLLEWHLLWSALSGMEILLIAALACLIFASMAGSNPHHVWLGVLVGTGVWIRPDALTLMIPVIWILLVKPEGTKLDRLRELLWLLIGAALAILPYLWFNYLLEGTYWPTTFYAKQAEYAVLREQPLLRRLVEQAAQPLTGIGILLLPGALWSTWRDARARAWSRLGPAIWACSFLGAYALRLPATYQHGRYAMPVLPVLIVLGIEGSFKMYSGIRHRMRAGMLARVWVLSLGAIGLTFLVLGARAYGMDVAIIETEMVKTAKWIAGHTDRDSLVAAHDIGAVGYFGNRQLLDLAGLISPQVIPILRNEPALASLLEESGADYLMTFPGWYPELTEGLIAVYRSQGEYSPQLGGENMTVYELSP
jgi:hypothetical protein